MTHPKAFFQTEHHYISVFCGFGRLEIHVPLSQTMKTELNNDSGICADMD